MTWLVVAKPAIQPLITWWLAYHVFGLDGIWAAAAVIHAALPTGVPVFRGGPALRYLCRTRRRGRGHIDRSLGIDPVRVADSRWM